MRGRGDETFQYGSLAVRTVIPAGWPTHRDRMMACGKISHLILAGDGAGLAWPPPASDAATAAMPAVTIAVDDPRASDIRALVERHLQFAASNKPPGDMHALDVAGLLDPAVTVFSCRAAGELLAVGALKRLGRRHAELKSMHTAEAARGRGIGRAMLAHLIGVARDRGIRRLSLKTGSQPAFAPARSLYATAGFTPCGPFSSYRPSRSSIFMTVSLDGPAVMPSHTATATLECAGNGRSALHPPVPGEQWGLGAAGTAAWTGVPPTEVLDLAAPRPGAREVVFRGADYGPVEGRDGPVAFERSLPLGQQAPAGALPQPNRTGQKATGLWHSPA